MYLTGHIPQTEQRELFGSVLFCLGNVTFLLTPSNPLPHPLPPSLIPPCVIQVQ